MHLEGFVVNIVGKMTQDVGMVEVLWCHLHLVWLVFEGSIHSLVPRPIPDLILQLWRKTGRRPGTNATLWTRNGGLDSYVMWTQFHNDGNVPTQYAASTNNQTVKFV